MYKEALVLFIKAITPVHAGSGSELGIVDLPIQREVNTGFPKIEGSTLKGAIRDAFETSINGIEDEAKLHLVFGYDGANVCYESVKSWFEANNMTQFSGAVGFSDARILLFPVKSVKGVFAYITCPMVIRRFIRDLNLAGIKENIAIPDANTVTSSSILLIDEGKVILEEFVFDVKECDGTDTLASEFEKLTGFSGIKERILVLDDTDFADFVKLYTEVITRTKIDNSTGTVSGNALFTEEYLPTETVMYSLVMTHNLFITEEQKAKLKEFGVNGDVNVKQYIKDNFPEVFQIGGNATIGKGFVHSKLVEGKNEAVKS